MNKFFLKTLKKNYILAKEYCIFRKKETSSLRWSLIPNFTFLYQQKNPLDGSQCFFNNFDMRLFLILILLCQISIYSGLHAQTQGLVKYKVKALPQEKFEDLKKEDPDKYKHFTAVAEKMQMEIEQLEFELLFNNHESIYRTKEFMSKESGMANKFGKAKGVFYNNIEEGQRIQQVETNGQFFLVNYEPIQWEVTSEKKKIGKYNTYKALSSYSFYDSRKNQNIEQEVVAWFAPEIPVSFGPEGYTGLPGLILQLDIAGGRYYVTELNLDEKVKIKSPTKGKKVTMKEYRAFLKKLNAQFNEFQGLN